MTTFHPLDGLRPWSAGAILCCLMATFVSAPLIAGEKDGRRTIDVSVLANGFPASSADTVVVSGMAELEAAVNAAPPGRHILIAPGTYAGGTLNFKSVGTDDRPVVVRPADGIGTVTIENANWTLVPGSSRLVLAELYFNKSAIGVNGSRHRITRCRFRQINRTVITIKAATDTRIDRCDFSDYTGVNAALKCVGLASAPIIEGTLRRVLVDRCHFHDIKPAVGRNGSELLGTLDRAASGENPEMIVEYCLFQNIDIPNEGEIFQSKMVGLVTRFCTFENMRMYNNVARLGANYELRSCWHENMMGVNVWGDDHLVVGNRFVGEVNMRVGAGDLYWKGEPQQGKQGHLGSRRARLVGNRMGSGHIQVGGFWGRGAQAVPALDNNLHANTRDAGGAAHTLDRVWQRGTTFQADNESYVPAVKLTPDEVGLFAPDPLCPEDGLPAARAGIRRYDGTGGEIHAARPVGTDSSVSGRFDIGHLVNGFPVSSADTVVVSDMDELEAAVNTAPPGRHILIAAGTYDGGELTFTTAGTKARPIVIKPQGARGSVTINSPTWTLSNDSSRLVLTNLHFTNAQLNLNGRNIRISRCRFRQVDRISINLNARDTRIDHIDVSDYVKSENNKRFISVNPSRVISGSCKGLLFDHNFFHDIDGSSASSGFIQMTGAAWDRNPGFIIDRCLFQNVVTTGRYISNKWSGSIIRYCTFVNVGPYLQQRLGGGWEIRSNWFEGPKGTAVALRCFDEHVAAGQPPQLVIGNRFVGDRSVWVGAGDTARPGPQGGGAYHASFNGRFIGNIFDEGTFEVGAMWHTYTPVVRATNNVFEANVRNGSPMTADNGINLIYETGTVIRAVTDEPFIPAVRLTPNDVGMSASDPFCPEGPQS